MAWERCNALLNTSNFSLIIIGAILRAYPGLPRILFFYNRKEQR